MRLLVRSVPCTVSRKSGAAAALLLAALSSLTGCQLFESTCLEDDRTCLNGGSLRSGKVCVRDGDCAQGLDCIDHVCTYVGSTKRGGDCIASAECEDGLYCSPSDLICRPLNADPQPEAGTCATSADCQRGLVCDADVNELFSKGPFGLLPEDCREQVDRNDTPESCALPRTCTARGSADVGGTCDTSRDCLAGLYCIPKISDVTESVCFGGETLPVEPISVPLWGGEPCPSDAEQSVAYFEVPRASASTDSDFYRLPFPNNIRLTQDGIDMSGHPRPPEDYAPQTAARYIEETASLTGFATNPVVYFRFSKPLRSKDLSLQTLRIVDITPESPEYARKASIAWGPTKRKSNYICQNWLGIHRPVGSPLRPGTTYAAIVTHGLHDDEGAQYERSADFEAMLDDSRPSDDTVADAWDSYAPLRAYLDSGDSDIPASEVLNAAVFTTQEVTGTLDALRKAVEDDGVPALEDLTVCKDGVRSPCEDDSGRGACHDEQEAFTEIHGRVRLPIFQRGNPPYETPDDGGEIALDDSGHAEIQEHRPVCIAISVPKLGQPPPDGYPLLIVAHPTGGSFSDQMGESGFAAWAATLEVPSAVLSFDLPVHGDRRGDSDRPPQDLYFNLVNPKSARGNALQGAADLMAVARLSAQPIAKEDSPLDGPITFDPERVALYAHSQGASHAALMIGGEPRIRAVVLAGLAGQITTQLLNLKRPVDTASIMPFLLFDPDTKGKLVGGDTNPLLALIQGYLDASDPVNFAPQLHLDPPSTAPDGHDVFFVYGLFDSFTPEVSQKAYADAAALVAVDPDLTVSFNEKEAPLQGNVMPGEVRRTVGLRTYNPVADAIDSSLVTDGHFVSTSTRKGSADVRLFLSQALQGETPQIGEGMP